MQIDSWGGHSTWLDDLHADALSQLFPGFITRCADPGWRKAISLAIDYYVNANRPRPVQLAVATAQIVLELLASTLLVHDLKKLSAEQIRARPASKNLRSFLRMLTIPYKIPEELQALSKLASDRGWKHGPWALTALRNEVVHLSIAREQLELRVWVEAWKLAMSYIELALLRLCGFSGEYASRLSLNRWQGQVERVPWAGSETE